jgi:Bacterial regulatory proteins, gntR family
VIRPGRLREPNRAVANRLQDWLAAHPHDELPRLRAIGAAIGSTGYDVWDALTLLEDDGKIVRRHGTRSENRGHQAIRIIATGRVLKTAGCPFDPPPPPGAAL